MHYFEELETILLAQNPQDKFERFETFYKAFKNDSLAYEEEYCAIELKEPSYKPFTTIVLPKDIKRRKYFDTIEGKAILLHTIAHIEYSAIDLALDAALRFPNLPKQYYEDWLEVAEDEIRHFKMIDALLHELGYKYGDFEVHDSLFEAMQKTPNLLERMAVVPRYLEANGLDQNPKIMEKLRSNYDEMNEKILEALNIILEEEIDHVTKGDRWYRYACELEDVEPESTYLKIVEKFYPGTTKRTKDMNFEARKKAGFSCDELKVLSNRKECE